MRTKDSRTGVLVVALSLISGLVAVLLVNLPRGSTIHALRFNGSNRVEIASTQTLEFGTRPFTVSLWFRTTTTNRNITFVSKRASAAGVGWGVFGQGDNQLLFYSAGCASPMSSPQPYRDGLWHQLLVVRNAGRVDIHYDRLLVGSGPERCDYRDQNPLLIGMDGELGHHLDGEIAEVHLYNTALTPEQIEAEWNGGTGSRESVAGPSLVAGYHFDEASGDLARDFSGFSHHGTLVEHPERTKGRR